METGLELKGSMPAADDGEKLRENEIHKILHTLPFESANAASKSAITGMSDHEYLARRTSTHPSIEDDHIQTSRSDAPLLPSSPSTPAPSGTSDDASYLSCDPSSQDLRDPEPFSSRRSSYLGANMPQNISDTNITRAESTSTLSSMSGSSLAAGRFENASAPQSPEQRPPVWRDFSTQTVIGHNSNMDPTRPTSVPNFQSYATSRQRRNGSDYPVYPNQSFAALHGQNYPPTYQSRSHPHPLRTRSSHPSQSLSYSSSASKTRDYAGIPSGAKTVGNTPAQSPGLFTPPASKSRSPEDDSEDGHCNTPLLHPTHLQAPKETHKLLKDVDPVSGRKLVNNYEIFERLGSGTHGTVKLGRNLDTRDLVAVKIVRRFSKKIRLGKSGDPNDMVKKEVAILKKARHPHVVSLLEVIDDDEFGKVYLILEYVELGEIVWRKQTDKDVAIFEMNRVRREKSGQIDEAAESTEIGKFNATAVSRRAAKARVIEEQKYRARTRSNIQVSEEQIRGTMRPPFWSLEYANDSEEESISEPILPPVTSSKILRSSSTDHEASQDSITVSRESNTPDQSDTPRPLQPSLSDEDSLKTTSGLQPISNPDSPASYEGARYDLGNLDQQPSDAALQSTLDKAIAYQSHWTAEEEEFMYAPCLTISQALDAFRDTVLGLEYLHYQGIIHRDIKPANLLWNADHRVKISDFGVSYLGKPIREDEQNEEISEADAEDLDEALELAKTVGTPAFYAPELCDPELFDIVKHPERPQITGQIDVWALGVTLYGMIFGRLPFFDVNEFAMYEKIARQEIFIPKMRLRGVKDNVDGEINSQKRPDDILEYEEVDEDLRDLIGKLLIKQPEKRISLKDVKNHQWVLRGIVDQSAWVDETDPSLQSQGKKIEVSNTDVQEAVIGLTIVDRIKSGIRRIGSVVRGRDSRKRGHSSAKMLENQTSTSPSAPKVNVGSQDARRPSLRGDEQTYSALRSSREGSEHPLSQSVAASPELKSGESYFENGNVSANAQEGSAGNQPPGRPNFLERTLSNAESTKTIRAPVPAIQAIASTSAEAFSPMTPVVDSSLSSGLGGIFGGAGRRFVNSMRSRERGRGRGRDSPSQSSRSSSMDTSGTGIDDPHASPSIAISSAVAAGHVDIPPALRSEISPQYPASAEQSSSTRPSKEDSQNPQSFEDYPRLYEHSYSGFNSVATAAEIPCPPSPMERFSFPEYQNPNSTPHPDEVHFGISSSSDQIASGMSESTSHPSIPSVVSGASSLSAQTDDYYSSLAKDPLSSTIVTSRGLDSGFNASTARFHSGDRLQALEVKAAVDDDEAGYNGEGELDSESDDEGIEIGGRKPK